MSVRIHLGSVLGIALSLMSGGALALQTDPDFAILCTASDIVVGDVLKATLTDPEDAACFQPWSCPQNSGMGDGPCEYADRRVTLRIKVTTILGSKPHPPLEPSPYFKHAERVKVPLGDVISVTTYLSNLGCMEPRLTGSGSGRMEISPPVRAASPAASFSPARLARFYVGKQFIFSVSAIRMSGHIDSDDYSSPSIIQPPGTFPAWIWGMDQLAWAKETIRSRGQKNCMFVDTRQNWR